MEENIKKKLVRNWFLTIQELICHEIENIENGSSYFKSKEWSRSEAKDEGGGKSKLFNCKELENMGFNIVIYPVTTQRLAMKNVEDGLRDIYANGHQNNIIDKMQSRKRLYELVNYEKYNSLDEKIYNFSTEGHE